jgi:A/G-specific adenine glycosylase
VREPDADALRRQLLSWYGRTKRDLPFRRTRDPYAILVAETILQRTRVAAGLPYYERFLARFPTVRDLAAATEADVLRAWEGLGFYRRARDLHRAAKAIVERFGGELPTEFEALRSLPGIGDYTAGAVGSIAFGLRAPAVDGNATRVLARLYRVEGAVSGGSGHRRIRDRAVDLVPSEAPGAWNQALMELGATVCTPRKPRCGECPLSRECKAFAAGVQDRLPRFTANAPIRVVPVVFVVAWNRDSVLLLRRAAGLHAGMYRVPGGEVSDGEGPEAAVRRHLSEVGVVPGALELLGPIRHAFSHLRWEGAAYACRGQGRPRGAEWVRRDRLAVLPIVPIHRRLIDRAPI